MTILSSQEAYQKSLQGGLLVDVRTKPEYEAMHARGAEHLPLDSLTIEKASELRRKVFEDEQILLLCKSGKRASRAASIFSKAGHPDVCVVEGGTDQWVQANLPHLRGPKMMSLERQVRIAAGVLVAVGAALTYWVNPAFTIVPAFVGCGLVFAGLTDWCGMGLLLAKMPWNR
ncbi:MAG: rhodanese-like domain-containing protein [Verrucomicrobiota bacterium]